VSSGYDHVNIKLKLEESQVMKTRSFKCTFLVVAMSLVLAGTLPGAASARQIWRQGQNVKPKLAACSLEKEVAQHDFISWDTCMGGQIRPPTMGGNATIYYLARRKKCEPRYKTFTKAENSYKACEKRIKSTHRTR
jgi:hypothetical protein